MSHIDPDDLISPPGETIRETLEYYHISEDTFGEAMGLSATDTQRLLRGELPLDESMAELLHVMLNIDKSFWVNREANYRTKLKEAYQ